jgi:hypothetical protein
VEDENVNGDSISDAITAILAGCTGYGIGFIFGVRWFEAISHWRVDVIKRACENSSKADELGPKQ